MTITAPEKSLQIVLIRHGQTEWNAEKRFLGKSDIPLDQVGHQQARNFASSLSFSFDAVYTSPLARASQTAQYLQPAATVVPTLQELDQGDLEGMVGMDALQKYPEFFAAWASDPSQLPVPGGESMEQCRIRALDAIQTIGQNHSQNQRVAVVSHQMVIASILCTLSNTHLRDWRHWRLGNLEAAWLHYPNGRLSIKHPKWNPQ
jgi:broad specificity phosphatase PhoE